MQEFYLASCYAVTVHFIFIASSNFIVVALGDAGSGKTCLIKHFCESKFSNCYHATVGVDYGFKVQTVKGIPLRVSNFY